MEEWFIFFGAIAVAMVTSHVCSLMEAALLSITPSQLAELRQKSPKVGQVCQALKHDIDKPIAVILAGMTREPSKLVPKKAPLAIALMFAGKV